jgi:hypothetical protein
MKSLKQRVAAAFWILIGSLAGSAQAWSLTCTGNFDDVLVRANGDLVVHSTWRSDWTYLCNVNAATGAAVSAKTCASWLALATVAVDTQKPTTTSYTSNTLANCAVVPTDNSAPAPDSVMFMKP